MWGECLKATPPPPVAEGELPNIVIQEPEIPEEAEAEIAVELETPDIEGDEMVAMKATEMPVPRGNPMKICPHACIAFSDTATWGSALSASETDVPSSQDDLPTLFPESDTEIDSDDDYVIQGGRPGGLDWNIDQSGEQLSDPVVTEAVKPTEDQLEAWLQSPPEDDADQEEVIVPSKRKRRGKRRKTAPKIFPQGQLDYAAAAVQASDEGHVDLINREALQQLVKEESGKRIVPAHEVRNSTGVCQERWKTAAEAELSGNFIKLGAFHESTPEELAQHGRPLPMLCVWSEADDYKKCRACVGVAILPK